MKKSKIFIYHLAVFLIGSVGIVGYFFKRLDQAKAAVIAMPVIAFVYIVGFGLLCLISLIIWLLGAYLHNRRAK